MALIAVVLILIVWAILDIKEKLTPQNPPIEDIGEHLKTIQSLPNQKAYFYKYAIMLSNK